MLCIIHVFKNHYSNLFSKLLLNIDKCLFNAGRNIENKVLFKSDNRNINILNLYPLF